jgi:hypothetical protein
MLRAFKIENDRYFHLVEKSGSNGKWILSGTNRNEQIVRSETGGRQVGMSKFGSVRFSGKSVEPRTEPRVQFCTQSELWTGPSVLPNKVRFWFSGSLNPEPDHNE